jgi:hypothetical protein
MPHFDITSQSSQLLKCPSIVDDLDIVLTLVLITASSFRLAIKLVSHLIQQLGQTIVWCRHHPTVCIVHDDGSLGCDVVKASTSPKANRKVGRGSEGPILIAEGMLLQVRRLWKLLDGVGRYGMIAWDSKVVSRTHRAEIGDLTAPSIWMLSSAIEVASRQIGRQSC